MSDGAALLLALALLAGNAFFVGAEFAVISARRTQIERSARSGGAAARITLRAMERVSLMLAGAQLGITVCSLGLGAVGEPAVAHLLEGPFAAAGVPDDLLHPIALVIALGIVVFLHMVIGEMVPKNIALAGPERSALILAPLLYGVVQVLRPVIWFLNWLSNLVLRLLRVEPKDEVTSTFTREEVADLVAESRREGLLDEEQHELLSGALGFVDRRVADIAIPRSQLVVVTRDTTVAGLERLCARTGYSRFPVEAGRAGADPGRLVGYVHLKDVLGVEGPARTRPVPPGRIRPLPVVSASDPVRDVLATMQRLGAHLAQVRDQTTGRVIGVVALEDVIEELVGEVQDATARG